MRTIIFHSSENIKEYISIITHRLLVVYIKIPLYLEDDGFCQILIDLTRKPHQRSALRKRFSSNNLLNIHNGI